MCGVFGFITSDGRGPDVARLLRIALVTQTRGAHAFGLAWVDADGALHTFKQPGPASSHLGQLECCRGARAVIGHCRYATHGSPADNRNNHPHVVGSGYLVHNGVITNHQQLLRRHRLTQTSQCDSEILGLLMSRTAGSIVQRAAWAANQVQGDLAMLGIWRSPARILVCRRGRPLHVGQAREGLYLASLTEGLPAKARVVTDGTARVVTYDDGLLYLDDDALRLAPKLPTFDSA